MGEYLAGCMQCSSLPGVGYGLQRMPMDSPGQIGCSLFSFLSFELGAGKRAVPVTTTVTLIVCVLLTSQLSGHRKSKRQEKEKKEREKTDQKRIKIGIHIPNKGRKGEKEKEQDQEK